MGVDDIRALLKMRIEAAVTMVKCRRDRKTGPKDLSCAIGGVFA